MCRRTCGTAFFVFLRVAEGVDPYNHVGYVAARAMYKATPWQVGEGLAPPVPLQVCVANIAPPVPLKKVTKRNNF